MLNPFQYMYAVSEYSHLVIYHMTLYRHICFLLTLALVLTCNPTNLDPCSFPE